MKQRYDNHVKRSNAAGAHDKAFAASKSVGIECVITSRKNSSLNTISFSNPPGKKDWFGSRIPDPRFTHEIKSRLMRNHRFLVLRVGPEKYSGAKYALKGGDEPTILRTALLHPENVEHFGSTAKSDGLFLLAHGKRSKEDRNEAVLPPWNPVRWMPGYLQQELTIAPLVQEDTFGGSFNGQSAQNKWPGSKAEILIHVVTLEPDQLNGFSLA